MVGLAVLQVWLWWPRAGSPELREELSAAGLGQCALLMGQAQKWPWGQDCRCQCWVRVTQTSGLASGVVTELVTLHTCKYSRSVLSLE